MSTIFRRHGSKHNGHDREGYDRSQRELRLDAIRREAQLSGRVVETGIRPGGAPLPPASPETGYYGMPLLKRPQWTWEVPFYFFTGGAAGAAAIMAACAHATGQDEKFIRDARWLAAIAGAVSPPLLIADLGMPERFLNMLRVFKIQSPMSVGSWTLVAFSSSAVATVFLDLVERRNGNGRSGMIRLVSTASEFLAAAAGLVLSTYTGVLIGATAVPVWNEHVSVLPIHFATSGTACASSILELCGHTTPALNALGLAAAAGETLIGARIELNTRPANAPLKRGSSGWMARLGGVLSGPLPLALRIMAAVSGTERRTKLRRAAAASSVAGSLVTRYAWLAAGKISARDPKIPLELPPQVQLSERTRTPLGELSETRG